MQLHTLPKSTTTGKKRLGLGHGSGRVKTAGRGTKGQKARGKVSLSFDGANLSMLERLPFLRGKSRNFSFQKKSVLVPVEKLAVLEKDTTVDIAALVKAGLVDAKEAKSKGVKILGKGTLTVALKVMLPVTQSAKEAIEKAGGSIVPSK